MGASERALGRRGLVSAQIFGSCAVKTDPLRANVRSDFDSFLVYDGTPTGFRACEEIISRTKDASYGLVPLGIKVYSQAALANGRHKIDRYFGRHLTHGERIVRGIDPATYLNYSVEPGLFILRNYLAHKKEHLTERGTSGDDNERVLGLQRMLEAPIAIGRKVLQVIDEIGQTEICPKDSTDKRAIASEALGIFSQMEVERTPLFLLFADQFYSEALADRLQGHTSQRDYVQTLNELDDLLPEAVAWIDAIDASVPDYLSERLCA